MIAVRTIKNFNIQQYAEILQNYRTNFKKTKNRKKMIQNLKEK